MTTAVLYLLITAVLVLANAFFVASEFAMVKIRATRLEQLAARGSRRARTALEISHRLDAYLSANQLGITLASLALGWIGEEAFFQLLEPLLGANARGIAAGLGFGIITFLHVVVGELAPKSLAIQRAEPVALWTAIPLRAFYRLAFPVIWTLNASAGLILRAFGLGRAKEVESLHSPDELRLILKGAEMEPAVRRIIDRAFDYSRHLARHIMTLRPDVVALHAEKGFDENLRAVVANQYTRYPLLEAGERVLGYVHIKDLFAAVVAGEKPDLRKLARPSIVFSEDTSVDVIRRELQRRGVHLAMTVDAAGAFAGIVTLEDLVEELVGEIRDEQDVGEVPPLVKGEAGFDADGRLTLDVLARETGLMLEEHAGGAETLGGLVAGRLGRIPRVGDAVELPGVRLVVVAMKERRVVRVRGETPPPASQP
jgi:CBS domain containing-hemolysin-like protein